MKKICRKCHRELDLGFFVKNKNCKDGHEGTCKECKNESRQSKYKTLLKQDHSFSTKICKKCGIEFPYTEFAIDLKARDGYRNICKSCDRERIRSRNEFNRISQNSTWWNTKADSVNERGKKKLPDKISGKDLQALYYSQNGKCVYCGVKLGTHFHVDHKMPISKVGRNILDNIVCCCADCNRLKWNRTHEDFIEFLKEYTNRMQYLLIRTEG